jgi:Fe-S-cluster containining protein
LDGGGFEVRSLDAPGRPCVFLLPDGLCRIHGAKPLACRSWPYIHGALSSEEGFQDAKACCPGLSGMDYEGFREGFLALDQPLPPRSFRAEASKA